MEENNNHKIKVPIFSSEMIEDAAGDLFDKPDYKSMIDYIKSRIDKFQDEKPIIKHLKTNKVKETRISNIEYFDSQFEGVPTLLLKVTAFNTNLIDGYVEMDEKINFEKNHKIGSENNFILIYPSITDKISDKFKYQWKFFIYDDPTKDSTEIISISKLVCKKILEIRIRNIKLESILKEIRERKILENIEIQLSSHYSEIDDPDIKLKNYIVSSKISKITKNNYRNVPSDTFESLIVTNGSFKRRIFKIFDNNRELRITQEHKDGRTKLSETIEEIFNSSIDFDESDLEKLFDLHFIERNIHSVLIEFIKDQN